MESENFRYFCNKKTVDYYVELSKIGLFNYEKLIIERFFNKHKKVLDIGCGAGRICSSLESDYDVVGIDYSPLMIGEAKKIATNSRLLVMDILKPIRDFEHYFDYVIFSFNGLMLLKNYQQRKIAMTNIKKMLKHGGLFFFSTPFLNNKTDDAFWKERINKTGRSIDCIRKSKTTDVGDIITSEDYGTFQIRVPFLEEVYSLIEEVSFRIVFSSRRLDICNEGPLEDELDDNWVWVVKYE